MRIVGGSLRGLKLAEIGDGDATAHLRPTSDRNRESIFNLLINGPHGNPVAEARVLDIFAGTGALGLEALSRGAFHATFIENGATSLALLRANIDKTRTTDRTDVVKRDATKIGANTGLPYDLIFLDPPYGKALGAPALVSAQAAGWIAPGAMIVWEEGSRPSPPAGWAQIDQRRYGDTTITLLRAPA